MNINEVKKRLGKLQNNGPSSNGSSDYANSFWKPRADEGRSTVRIVPYKFNKDYPFSELYFHFNVGKMRMLALTNFGESDPIVEVTNELRRSSDAEMKELAKKISPRLRYFVPVVVRGEEDKGVRFWEFGKQVYTTLLKDIELLAEDGVTDITDVYAGNDISVEMNQEAGKLYPTTTVRIKSRSTSLHDDPKMVERFLDDQKELTSIYKKYSFDEMKTVLQNHMTSLQGETEEVTHVEQRSASLDDSIDDLFGDE
jgi:hypothetical protein